MSISALNQTAQASQNGSQNIRGSKLSSADFMKLMVLQLKNQNPTKPADTNQFMKQVLSLANYESQAEMNQKLDKITAALGSMMMGNGLGYIGRTIEAAGDTTALQSGEAKWSYSLASKAKDVTIKVLDENGDVVFEKEGQTGAGKHDFVWDGKGSDGKTRPDGGKYTIKIEAKDADGKAIEAQTTITGKVTGVDASGDKVYLNIGDANVLMQSLLKVLDGKSGAQS